MISYYCPACDGYHPKGECPEVARLKAELAATNQAAANLWVERCEHKPETNLTPFLPKIECKLCVAAALSQARAEGIKEGTRRKVETLTSSTCVYLSDGTKVVVKRDGKRAWLEVISQSRIYPAEAIREQREK